MLRIALKQFKVLTINENTKIAENICCFIVFIGNVLRNPMAASTNITYDTIESFYNTSGSWFSTD